MLSQKLVDMLNQMRSANQTETQLEAARDLREELEKSALHQACLRCSKASYTTIWRDQYENRQQHCWAIIQIGCGAYLSLPPNGEAGFGFSLAADNSTVFFCSSEDASGAVLTTADSAELGSRWRGPSEAERSAPRRIADRG